MNIAQYKPERKGQIKGLLDLVGFRRNFGAKLRLKTWGFPKKPNKMDPAEASRSRSLTIIIGRVIDISQNRIGFNLDILN